ncbi:MAG: hypothetical protein KC609_16275 [Myxococcales bacterium]|nr:hypothetical protein [Myxococcales bacterium]
MRKRSFIAFSADGTEFLIKMDDTNMGTLLEYWKLGGDKPYKKRTIPESKWKKYIERLTKKKYPDKGAKGGATEDGKYSVQSGPMGKKKFNLMIANDKGALARFKTLDVLKDKPTGKFAVGKVKEMVWDKSGKRLVVVFNQRLESQDWTRDIDEVLSYKVNPLYLPFKKLPE